MEIKFNRKFRKRYQRFNLKRQLKVDNAINIFRENPFDQRIQNHSLYGGLSGKNAIKADYDLRIVFEEFENYTMVLFVDVGSHGEVY